MVINIKDPVFNLYLTNMTNNVLSHVTVDKYFDLSDEKKLTIQHVIIKSIKNLMTDKLNDTEFRNFILILWKKNEDDENYEFVSVLKDIISNCYTMTVPEVSLTKQTKTTKINKTT